MEWLNLRLTQLSAPEYIRSAPIERATWLQLLAYCCGQENSGLIPDCADWKDRVWQQTCGVTLKEVKADCRLWTWDGPNLHVWGYPVEKERLVQINRDTGRTGGLTKALNRAKAKLEPTALATLEPSLEGLPLEEQLATLEQTLLRKGKEGKGKEGKTTTTTTTREDSPQQADSPNPAERNVDIRSAATQPGRSVSPPLTLNRGCTLDEAFAFADKHNQGSSLAGFQIPHPVVTLWHDSRAAAGWNRVRDGIEFPIADWQADLRHYAQHYAKNERIAPGQTTRPFRNAPAADAKLTTAPKGGF